MVEQSGWAVSMSYDGNRLAVASPQNDAGGIDAGKVQVYEYSATDSLWLPLGAPFQGVAGAGSGQSISISGDGRAVAVGSFRLFPYTGFVDVYRYQNRAWHRLTQIVGKSETDRFGGSVSLNYSGDRVAIGAAYHADRGLTQVWERHDEEDTEFKLIAEIGGVNEGDRSGHAVALSLDGTTVAIGGIAAAPSALDNAGTTAVFHSTSSTATGWTQLGADIPGVAAGDQSGYAVVSGIMCGMLRPHCFSIYSISIFCL